MILHVRVHVPHAARVVGHAVGRAEVVPQTAVVDSGVRSDEAENGIFQGLSALAVERLVIACWGVGDSDEGRQQQRKCNVKFTHIV
jgi:hypothetical protein